MIGVELVNKPRTGGKLRKLSMRSSRSPWSRPKSRVLTRHGPIARCTASSAKHPYVQRLGCTLKFKNRVCSFASGMFSCPRAYPPNTKKNKQSYRGSAENRYNLPVVSPILRICNELVS